MKGANMTRYQRKRQMRARKRLIVLSFIFCLIFLFTGILVTNKVMVEIMLLPESENIFSFQNISRDIKNTASPLKDWLSKLIGYCIGVLKSLIEMLK